MMSRTRGARSKKEVGVEGKGGGNISSCVARRAKQKKMQERASGRKEGREGGRLLLGFSFNKTEYLIRNKCSREKNGEIERRGLDSSFGEERERERKGKSSRGFETSIPFLFPLEYIVLSRKNGGWSLQEWGGVPIFIWLFLVWKGKRASRCEIGKERIVKKCSFPEISIRSIFLFFPCLVAL